MDDEVYAFTWPLITDATGKKFGKSEGNALFLDKNKTSPYVMYQYFMNSHDEDLDRYFKLLTLLENDEIASILSEHTVSPELRSAQKRLAYEIVKIIHGEKDAQLAQNITEFLFGENDKLALLKNLSNDELQDFAKEIGMQEFSDQNLFGLFIDS